MVAIELYIYPFFTCNYRCKYCYLEEEDLKSKEKLNLNCLSSLLNTLTDISNNIKISILGGEPTLDVDYLRDLLKTINNYQLAIKEIKISTNGSIIDKKRIELLKKFDEVQVSLDAATPETYKKIRGGNFRRVIDNIKMMVSEGIPITLSFVAMKSNINELDRFFVLSKNLRVKKISIGYLIPNKNNIHIKQETLGLKELKILRDKVKNLQKIHNIPVHHPFPDKLNQPFICSAGNKKFVILPNGTIVPCILLREYILGECGHIDKLLILRNRYSICPIYYRYITSKGNN